nr:RNA-dependent RNA polymerase [Sobelivirales sp.]
MRLARSNGELLATHRELVVGLVVDRLRLIQQTSVEAARAMSAGQLVDAGLTDEVRLFVKNELHSELKVQQGRMRLIASISVLDQLVERVLNGPQNREEIRLWESIPSKPGLGLHDEGLKSLEDQIRSIPHAASSDVSGFDWSVSQWMLDWDAEVRGQLSAAGCLSHMFLVRATCLGLSRFVFSDGVRWDQVTPGIQKSGSYNTSSTNSRLRVMLMWLTGIMLGYDGGGIAMGDDAVETLRESESAMTDAYALLGFRLKEVSRGGALEFCAYSFDLAGRFEPVRWHKMLASMLATSPRDDEHRRELLVALQYELRHSPHSDRAFAVLHASGWGARK